MVCSGQVTQHDADRGEAEEGGDGSGVTFEVARQAAVAADPGKGALDDPALGQDDEEMGIAALGDFQVAFSLAVCGASQGRVEATSKFGLSH